MSKERPKKSNPEPDPEAPVPIAPGKRYVWNPASDVELAFIAFMRTFKFKPAAGDVIDEAMRLYLRAHGFPELAAQPPPD